MKSFARLAFLRDSLGYYRYYDFIRHSVGASLLSAFSIRIPSIFASHLLPCFSCSSSKPRFRSCPLNAVCRVASNQVIRYTLSRWVADPIDFDTVKVIFDTSIRVCLRSTPITTPYNYSTYKRWHCFNLDAQYQFSLNQHLKAV